MIHKLYQLFSDLGYTWKIDGKDQNPTEKDLEQTLDRAKAALYSEPIPSQLEVGNLLIKHTDQDTFDIYLRIGEI